MFECPWPWCTKLAINFRRHVSKWPIGFIKIDENFFKTLFINTEQKFFYFVLIWKCFSILSSCDILSSTWVEVWILRKYKVLWFQKLNKIYQTLNEFEFIKCFWLKLVYLVKIPDVQMLVWNIFLQPYQNLLVDFFIHEKSLPILINQVKKL